MIYRICKAASGPSSGGSRSSRPRPATPERYTPPYQTSSEEQPDEESSRVRVVSPPRGWRSSEHELTVKVCASCGKWNNLEKRECWSCNKSLAKSPKHTQKIETHRHCVVCKAELYPGERIVLCPSCQAQGHHGEYLEFMKVKGECPDCGERFRPSHLLDAEPLE